MIKKYVGVVAVVLISTASAHLGHAGQSTDRQPDKDKGISATVYSERDAFESGLGNIITDDFSALGYMDGDISNVYNEHEHTDPHFSAVLGETQFQVTVPAPHHSMVYLQDQIANNWVYCTGCNGSARLTFTATSVGTPKGVYGVGFDIYENFYSNLTHAFVTFGDGTTADFVLPYSLQEGEFWGITSKKMIASIHLGGPSGVATDGVYWKLDNLTIGSRGHGKP